MRLAAIALPSSVLTFVLPLLLAAMCVRAQVPSDLMPVPEMKGYVADMAGVLTQEEKDRFTSLVREVATRSGSQLGVVVVDHTDPEPIEEFAQRVFTTWKLGRKGIDDGALLVLAINNKGRRLRIHVGYGLEGTITDAVAKRLLAEQVRPALERAGPGAAIDSAVNTLSSLMLKANVGETNAMIEAREAAADRLQWGTLAQVGLVLVTIVLMTRPFRLSTRLAVITGAANDEVSVLLAGIPDNKRVKVILSGVSGSGGGNVNAMTALGFLLGDFNQSRAVNAVDVSSIKARTGQPAGAGNFRFDVNLSGTVDATDIAAVRARSGQVVP